MDMDMVDIVMAMQKTKIIVMRRKVVIHMTARSTIKRGIFISMDIVLSITLARWEIWKAPVEDLERHRCLVKRLVLASKVTKALTKKAVLEYQDSLTLATMTMNREIMQILRRISLKIKGHVLIYN